MNIHPSRHAGLFVVFSASLLLGGCANLSQPYPAKESFSLGTPTISSSGMTNPGVLRVEPVRVAAPFDARSFHLRLSETRFEADYYHEFVADPDTLLTAELVRLLQSSGAFETVVEPGAGVETPLRLETSVLNLHADYRAAAPMEKHPNPAAVVRARFILLEDRLESTVVRADVSLESRRSFASDAADPGAFAKAVGEAWADIIARASQHLSQPGASVQ